MKCHVGQKVICQPPVSRPTSQRSSYTFMHNGCTSESFHFILFPFCRGTIDPPVGGSVQVSAADPRPFLCPPLQPLTPSRPLHLPTLLPPLYPQVTQGSVLECHTCTGENSELPLDPQSHFQKEECQYWRWRLLYIGVGAIWREWRWEIEI